MPSLSSHPPTCCIYAPTDMVITSASDRDISSFNDHHSVSSSIFTSMDLLIPSSTLLPHAENINNNNILLVASITTTLAFLLLVLTLMIVMLVVFLLKKRKSLGDVPLDANRINLSNPNYEPSKCLARCVFVVLGGSV